jgi:hypothetical protein
MALLFLLGGTQVALGCGDGSDTAGAPGSPRPTVNPAAKPPRAHPHHPVPSLAIQPRHGRYFAILAVRDGQEVPLRSSPGGRLIRTLSPLSEFGSPRVLSVVRSRGAWLGVTTPVLPDGELGWVRFDPLRMQRYWTRYSIKVLLGRRRMQLRYGDRVLHRFTVTIGAAASATPSGRFAVTDALDFGDSPDYGCCALALSGHQSHLPVGWLGGDRIAIHGTPGPVGEAASHGCIRATDETMHLLFRSVPLGTPVFVSD